MKFLKACERDMENRGVRRKSQYRQYYKNLWFTEDGQEKQTHKQITERDTIGVDPHEMVEQKKVVCTTQSYGDNNINSEYLNE